MPPTVHHNYYAILGITQSADQGTIKSAYKRLALVKHPDRRRNDPNATSEFQLLNEAYEHLYDATKRRNYDRIYQSMIGPREIAMREIEELEQKNRLFEERCKEQKWILSNENKDLVRLHAERDSIKGEKERTMSERATEETWWLYICSFMPGKAAEFTRQRQQRECVINKLIGKQRTKEQSIDLKMKEMEELNKEFIKSITPLGDAIGAKIQTIERLRAEYIQQEAMRRFADFRRAEAARTRTANQAYSTMHGYRDQFNTGRWDF